MLFAAGFFGLLILIFLLSKSLSLELGRFFFRLFHSEEITVRLMAFLFLPGTVVHEFSHAAVAQVVGVHVGDMELMPKMEGNSVKLGSVQVAQTDPIRRFLIGVSPLIVGLTLLFVALALYDRLSPSANLLWSAVFYYLVFQVGNAMFSSRRDMEGAIELFVAIAIVTAVLYFFGVRFSFDWTASALNNFSGFFAFGAGALLKIVILDLGVILLAFTSNRIPGSRRN